MKHNDSIMVTYEAPKCTIMDIKPEGVLCQSGKMSIQSFEYDEEDSLGC